jgi:hypothetical protein
MWQHIAALEGTGETASDQMGSPCLSILA